MPGIQPPERTVGPPERIRKIQPKTPAEGLAEYARRTGTYIIDPGMPSYAPGTFVGPDGVPVQARTAEEARQVQAQLKAQREKIEREAREKDIAEWRARALKERESWERKETERKYRQVEREHAPTPYSSTPERKDEIVAGRVPNKFEQARERILGGIESVRHFVGKKPKTPYAVQHTIGLTEYVGKEAAQAKGAVRHTAQLIRHRPKTLARGIKTEAKESLTYAYEHPLATVATVGVVAGAAAVAPVATGAVVTASVAKSFMTKPERGIAEAGLIIGTVGAIKGAGKVAGRFLPKKPPKITPFVGEARLKDTGLIAEYGKSVVTKGKVKIVSEAKGITELLPKGKKMRTKGVVIQKITEPGKGLRTELIGIDTRATVKKTGAGLSSFLGKSKIKEGTKIRELTIAGKVKETGKRTTPKGVRTEHAIISAGTPDIIRPPKVTSVPEFTPVFSRMKHYGRKKPLARRHTEIDYGFEVSEISAGAVSFKTPKKLGLPFRVGEPKTLILQGQKGAGKARLFHELKHQRKAAARERVLEIEAPKLKSKDIFTVARDQREARMFSYLDSVSPKAAGKAGKPLEIMTTPSTGMATMALKPEMRGLYDKPVPSTMPAVAERLAIEQMGKIGTGKGARVVMFGGKKAEAERTAAKSRQAPKAKLGLKGWTDTKPTEIPRVRISEKIKPIITTIPKYKTDQTSGIIDLPAMKKPAVKLKEKTATTPKIQIPTPPRPPRTPSKFLMLGGLPRPTRRRKRARVSMPRFKSMLSPLADPLSLAITEARTLRKGKHLKPTKRVRKAFARELMRSPGMVRFPTYQMTKRKGGFKI